MSDDTDPRVRRLHKRLEATGERPIDPRTNRWLGEAEAVARDATTPGLDEATVLTRIGQVRELLAEAGGTGDAAADDHLASARELCDRILEESE